MSAAVAGGGGSKRVLFVGGGTGGHLTPALGLAEELERRGHRCFFLVAGRAVEAGYFADRPEHASLGVDRSRLPRPLAVLAAMRRVRREARRFRPHAVVALGGATSVAALGWGRAPLVLLEGNVDPGRAVRLMQRRAAATLTLFEGTAKRLQRGRQVGPIGRAALHSPAREAACAAFGLDPARPVLLSAGGSQGAREVNDFVRGLLPELAARGVQLLALAGPGRAGELRAALEEQGAPAPGEAGSPAPVGVVLEHCADMGAAYAAADFAVLRGGASTMAELLLFRLPALVLPYPHHKDRQQFHNAAALAPGVRCAEGPDQAARTFLLRALEEPAVRDEMRAALLALAPTDGAARAAAAVEEIALADA